MSTVTVQSRVEVSIKEQAEAILSGMGMSTADAIRIFLHQVINQQGLPFQPFIAKIPNEETLQAFQETKDRKNLKTYNNIDEIFDNI